MRNKKTHIPLLPSTCRKHFLLFFMLPPSNERSGDMNMGGEDSRNDKKVWVSQQPPVREGTLPMFQLIGVCCRRLKCELGKQLVRQ